MDWDNAFRKSDQEQPGEYAGRGASIKCSRLCPAPGSRGREFSSGQFRQAFSKKPPLRFLERKGQRPLVG
jgi:hypothetical protein